MSDKLIRPQLTINTSHSNKPFSCPVSPLDLPAMDLPTTGVATPVSPMVPSPIGNPAGVAFSWDYWPGLKITMNLKLVQSLIS